jgi:AbrB family looped-hinge helix DNA binding protein
MDGLSTHDPREQFMALVKVRRAAQITLPREIRDAAHLAEGDYLEAELTREGILLRPVSIGSREPSPEQEAEILAIVDQERKAYAAERRR